MYGQVQRIGKWGQWDSHTSAELLRQHDHVASGRCSSDPRDCEQFGHLREEQRASFSLGHLRPDTALEVCGIKLLRSLKFGISQGA